MEGWTTNTNKHNCWLLPLASALLCCATLCHINVRTHSDIHTHSSLPPSSIALIHRGRPITSLTPSYSIAAMPCRAKLSPPYQWRHSLTHLLRIGISGPYFSAFSMAEMAAMAMAHATMPPPEYQAIFPARRDAPMMPSNTPTRRYPFNEFMVLRALRHCVQCMMWLSTWFSNSLRGVSLVSPSSGSKPHGPLDPHFLTHVLNCATYRSVAVGR
mmetsp:Transcript_45401/g.112784  ORF Transcript_45401/g.112784 Transcript_45401/m.112784 type:complete len:214 (-) Transcript_45401:1344-1985(-)